MDYEGEMGGLGTYCSHKVVFSEWHNRIEMRLHLNSVHFAPPPRQPSWNLHLKSHPQWQKFRSVSP